MEKAEAAKGQLRTRLGNWTGFRNRDDRIPIVPSLVIGPIVGLTVVAFILLTGRLAARMYPPNSAAWRRVLAPTAGALFSGFLLYRYFPNARRSGIPHTKFALYIRNGYIPPKTVIGKLKSASATIAARAPAHFTNEIAEGVLSLAEKLWRAERTACGEKPSDRTALDLIMKKLAS